MDSARVVGVSNEPIVEPTIRDAVSAVERLYPPKLAADWDRIGVVCGRLDQPLTGVVLAIDLTDEVIDFALDARANFILVHHPLFLSGVHDVAESDFKGKMVHRLIESGVALMVAHTNADAASPGVSDALADIIGLLDTTPLDPVPLTGINSVVVFVPEADAERLIDAMSSAGAGSFGGYDRCASTTVGLGTFRPGEGSNPYIGNMGEIEVVPEVRIEMLCPFSSTASVVEAVLTHHPYEVPAYTVTTMANVAAPKKHRVGVGRVGRLPEPVTLGQLAERVAAKVPQAAQGIRVAGDLEALVSTVAVCGGSGDSYLDLVNALGADVYVTADLKHHRVRDHIDAGGSAVIDLAHWASEFPWCEQARALLSQELAGGNVVFKVCPVVTDPWSGHYASRSQLDSTE